MAERLARVPGVPPVELVPMRTTGDLQAADASSPVSGRAVFAKEIEDALLAGEVDLAVHSLKDLATVPPQGLALGAVLARADPRDVLVARGGRAYESLPAGARVGTCSLRRRALLLRWRADLDIVDLRGNVPTRLRRLDEGECEAVVLAAAGLERLGLASRVTQALPLERVLPAPGQGAIAVEVRADDVETRRVVATLDDAGTRAATAAERALLRRLEGGCQVPVGALAELRSGSLLLSAIVCALDGSVAVAGRREGDPTEPAILGEELAEDLWRRGADAILTTIRAGSEAGR